MDFQLLPYSPQLILQGPLEEQPTEFQVAYLKQQVSSQRQLMAVNQLKHSFDSHINGIVESQTMELQRVTADASLAANNRVKKLEEILYFQDPAEQESLLNDEKVRLTNEIDQLKVMHQDAWTALLKSTAAKVENIALKVKAFVLDLDSFITKSNEKIKEIEILLNPSRAELDVNSPEYQLYVRKYMRFRAAYPEVAKHRARLFPQEVRDSKIEVHTAALHRSEIQKCLRHFEVNWEAISKNQEYINLKTGKPLEALEDNTKIQRLLATFYNDNITKLKVSNAYLKVLKNDMHEFQIESRNAALSCVYNMRIKPCLLEMKNYSQIISEIDEEYLSKELPEDCNDKTILSPYINRGALIKVQLDKLHAEIEKDAQELIKNIKES